jgi:hypothetical protein
MTSSVFLGNLPSRWFSPQLISVHTSPVRRAPEGAQRAETLLCDGGENTRVGHEAMQSLLGRLARRLTRRLAGGAGGSGGNRPPLSEVVDMAMALSDHGWVEVNNERWG